MKCPKCNFEQDDGHTECLRCGIIFSKFQHQKPRKTDDRIDSGGQPPPQKTASSSDHDDSVYETSGGLKELLFGVNPEADPIFIWVKCILLAILLFFTVKLCLASIRSNTAGNFFLHYINLPFHETGHIIFRPFGRLLTSMGGSITQLLLPLICLVTLLIKTRDAFGASVAFWWFGENFLDMAPYIDDARRLTLPLVGGNTGKTSPYGFHDWEFILAELGLLRYDHALAKFSHGLGSVIMVTALLWGGYCLYLHYKESK